MSLTQYMGLCGLVMNYMDEYEVTPEDDDIEKYRVIIHEPKNDGTVSISFGKLE